MADSTAFPLESWLADMRTAIEDIRVVAGELLSAHRNASEKANEAAVSWRLEERLTSEKQALLKLLAGTEAIVSSIGSLRPCLAVAEASNRPGDEAHWEEAVLRHTGLLEVTLPGLDAAFAEIRHCALDLLRWSSRAGYLEGSEWPDRYRRSYAKLISYAPSFDALSQSLNADVESLRERIPGSPVIREFLPALTQQRQLRELFRGFLKSVVEPPLELVFHETDTFLTDWQTYPKAAQVPLATEFNDCCQLLLYSPAVFHTRVDTIKPPLIDGMEASLFLLAVEDERILFLADEDPVFHQIVITLLRIIKSSALEAARDSIINSVYEKLLHP